MQLKNQRSELVTVVMRPIIAGPCGPTHRLSLFLDILLRPLFKGVQAYVRDTSDIISKLPKTAAGKVQLATFDVENLYGTISIYLGMRAIEYWLEEISLPRQRISKKFSFEGLVLVLENNYFFFNGNFYRQILGTEMGTKLAPVTLPLL